MDDRVPLRKDERMIVTDEALVHGFERLTKGEVNIEAESEIAHAQEEGHLVRMVDERA